MAMNTSRGRNNTDHLHIPRKWKDRDSTPERTRLWTAQTSTATHDKFKNGVVGAAPDKKVPVVYYLCRNGQLEHPHFMEVPLSNPDALYLKDVINRFNVLRGNGMATLYSWSSKRSYRNGFVWHDLSENDLIYPSNGHEYVLKGSEILDFEPLKELSSEKTSKVEVTRRRNQSWSSIDMNEYKVYKAQPFSESARRFAADASTQTDEKRRRRRVVKREEIEDEKKNNGEEIIEISPPPSDSSPETLESLMKADGRLVLNSVNEESESNRTVDNVGKLKASTVLMQLISCGSISFRDCGATCGVKEQGLSLIGQFKGRVPRGGGGNRGVISRENSGFSGVRLEDKEYFSGSLIETKKEEVYALKRSNSYNADSEKSDFATVSVQKNTNIMELMAYVYNNGRSTQFQLVEKEIEGVRTKCIPRKSKAVQNKSINVGDSNNSQAGSKRIDESPHEENEAK